MTSRFRRIVRRIRTGRAYNDETDAAIREALSRQGSGPGPGECRHESEERRVRWHLS